MKKRKRKVTEWHIRFVQHGEELEPGERETPINHRVHGRYARLGIKEVEPRGEETKLQPDDEAD